MNCRLLMMIVIALGISASAENASDGEAFRDSVLIHFRQSKVNVDSSYMDNRDAFRHIERMVSEYHKPESNYGLRSVRVRGGASPEGSVKFNEWLSKERAARIYEALDSRIPLPDSLISQTLLGRDWEGLLKCVEEDQNVPDRQEVIERIQNIIDNCKSGEKESDHNLERLKSVGGGWPYLYLYHHLFPGLRESEIVMTYGTLNKPLPLDLVPEMPLASLTVEDLVMPPYLPLPEVKKDKPFYMALKTNLLLDALAIPEGGIEFYLGKNFSIVGNWEYGWWDKDSAHRYWRMYGGDLALRWWFGRAAHAKPLTGHHIGVYGGVVTYDFEFGGKGYMGGRPGHPLWDRCNHYFGVEYGYSLPVARRLNLDFTLGLGYLGGKYLEYVPMDKCYVWQKTKYRHWYGPTKLEVSLVWLLGHGNVNMKKGGLR